MTKEVPSKIEAGGILHRLPVFVHFRESPREKVAKEAAGRELLRPLWREETLHRMGGTR